MSFSNITQALKDSEDLYFLTDEERKQLQQVLISILKDFIKACDDNNLTYMLCGGTALGAVRHKGIIPWDDDIDVMMPREDYEKFKKVYEKELSKDYTYYAPNSDYPCIVAFGKLIKNNTKMVDIFNCESDLNNGIFIDIFPIDYAPNNKALRKIKGFFANVLYYTSSSIFMYKYNNGTVMKFLEKNEKGFKSYKRRLMYGKLFSVIGLERMYKICEDFIIHKPSNYMTIASGRGHYDGEIVETTAILPVSKAVFEGVEVSMPNSPHKYLENLYGDYMKIPPEEKRERHYFIDLKF